MAMTLPAGGLRQTQVPGLTAAATRANAAYARREIQDLCATLPERGKSSG
jgi:hypothetical protein